MKLEFKPLSGSIAGEWDRLVQGSPDGSAFSLSAWLGVMAGVTQWKVTDHSFAVYENAKLVAVMPVQSSALYATRTGWSFTGPVLAGELAGRRRERILTGLIANWMAIATHNGWPKLQMMMSPVTRSALAARWGVNPFIFQGFKDVSFTSQVIDLEPDEATLLAAVSENARRLMRRARESGVTTRPVAWPDFVDRYHEVASETFARTGGTAHPKAYFEAIAREMAPHGHAALFAAFNAAGEPIAFVNLSRFGQSAIYHTGCSRTEALSSGAHHLLMWDAILSAKRNGALWFDVGPVNPKTDDPKEAGLTRYKTKFGGEPHRCFCCEMPVPGAPGEGNAA